MEPEELTYARGELSAEQLQQEIARFWAELKESQELQEEVAAQGNNMATLRDIESATAIKVRLDSSGTDPASVVLIVALAPSANRALKDLWATILLPRIRRRWGDDAIGDESQPDRR